MFFEYCFSPSCFEACSEPIIVEPTNCRERDEVAGNMRPASRASEGGGGINTVSATANCQHCSFSQGIQADGLQ